MKTKRQKSIFKYTVIICFLIINFNLSAQNIISRDILDYPDGDVPEICGTDPSNSGCIITLAPALPGENYSFQIPFVNEAERPDFLFTFVGGGCAEGSVTFTTDGTIEMDGDNICQPFDPESNYIEILLLVNKLAPPPVDDSQEFRIPIYREPVKVVFVIDISGSMEQIVPEGIEVRWDVLKSSVNKFMAEFEKNYQVGDSISVIYYSEDTVMPGSPIDSNFIAITPDDFIPSNLKSSEIINADMQNQTLQGSAAMGNALLLAKSKLQNADATKIVILFTDGYQDEEPLVHKLDGNKLSNEELLNDLPYDPIKSIAYYTVGIGIDYLLPTVLKSISNASGAKNLSAPSIVETFNIFFDSDFLNMLKGIREPIKTRIIDLSPFDDSLHVPVSNDLKVYFNESVNANSGNIIIKRTSDDSEFESISVSSGNVSGSGSSVITIDPDSDLESNTEYYILIDGTAFKNNADETVAGISNETYWNFTTEDIIPPNVVISTSKSDPTDANPIEITIEFSEEINGFDISEIDVTNGSANNLATTDSIEFTSDIIPVSDGLVSVNINSGVVTDNGGNLNTAADEFTIAYSNPTNIEILEKAGISIYTTDGFVIVDFKNTDSQKFKTGSIEIYSLNGSLIKKEKLENNSHFKTYLNNQRGIYLVKLQLDSEIYYSKIQN